MAEDLKDDDDLYELFSADERNYISERVRETSSEVNTYKHIAENTKKSLVEAPWSNESPYDDDLPNDDGSDQNIAGADNISNNDPVYNEDGANRKLDDQQHTGLTDSAATSNDADEQDNIGNKIETFIGNNDKENSQGEFPEDTTQDSGNKIINNFIADQDKEERMEDAAVHNVEEPKKKKAGHKRMTTSVGHTGEHRSKLRKGANMISVRNQTFYDGEVAPTPNALAKLKKKAEKHMESMSTIDITKTSKSKKIASKNNKETNQEKKKAEQKKKNEHAEEQNAKLDSKEAAENDELPGKDEGDLQDPDQDFQKSLDTIQSGWDLDKYEEDDDTIGGESNDSDDSDGVEGKDTVSETDQPETTTASLRKSKTHPTKKTRKHLKKRHHHHHKSTVSPNNNNNNNNSTNILHTAYEEENVGGNLDPYGSSDRQYNYNEFPNNDMAGTDPYNSGVYYGSVHDSMQPIDLGNNQMSDQLTGEFQQPSTTTESSQPKPSQHHASPTIGLGVDDKPDPSKKGQIQATRVCKPGVAKPFFHGKPNCLIIGDSIALG